MEKTTQQISQFQAKIQDRIGQILGPDFVVESDMSITYSWDHGYEVVTVKRDSGGGLEFRGSYHPNVTCEGNPCHYCGMARIDDQVQADNLPELDDA